MPVDGGRGENSTRALRMPSADEIVDAAVVRQRDRDDSGERLTLAELACESLGDETWGVLLALEDTLGDTWLYAPAADVAERTALTTDEVAGRLRWLERAAMVCRNPALYNGHSWWGLTDDGKAVLDESR